MQESTQTAAAAKDSLKYIIGKLRSITTAVQIKPFVYTLLYICALIFYLFASERVISLLDTLFYVSPIVVIGNLIESRILKLCKWHKTACILPALPQVNLFIDRYIYEFSIHAELAHITMTIIMAVLLLVAAYNVFFK